MFTDQKSKTIVIADDEPDMLQLVGNTLRREGYRVVTATNGEGALESIAETQPDLAILDMMMPAGSGLDVCRVLRSHRDTASLPVIMLSACTTETDRVVAFEIGVDDYVTKPFSPRELLLRVRAILRHAAKSAAPEDVLVVGGIRMDRSAHKVSVASQEVWLTSIEFNLLRVMMQAPGRVQSRDVLMNEVWGGELVEPRSIDTQVRRLRAKLGSAADQIETVRSFGYRLSAK